MAGKSKKDKDLEFDGTGLSVGEKRSGTKRFDTYKERYHIDNISDLLILSELVFRECLHTRYKKQIEKNAETQNTATEDAKIPQTILTALNGNLETILNLKKELGLLREEKGDDPFKYIQQLKKKFKKWCENNQASRSLKCPHCSKMIMLKIRTEKWDAEKHPFFKDSILTNKHLIKLYKDKIITKEDVGKILGSGIFFVNWLVDKWYNKLEQPSD